MMYKIIIGSALMCSLLVLIGIGIYSHMQSTPERIRVVCTTSMITDAVRIIGGTQLEVIGLMQPGIDPHTYHARESDVHKLATADIVFYHGLHLEGKLANLLERVKSFITTYAVACVLDTNELLSTEFQDIYDPHVWHDVQLWIKIVQGMCEQLCSYDNAHEDIYRHNTCNYIAALRRLDEEIRSMVLKIPETQRILITAHDAFHYFAHAYGFRVIGLQGVNTDAQVSMHDVAHLAEFIVSHQVRVLFLESCISHRNLYAVQEAVHARGWHVLIADELHSDSLGNYGTDAGTYIGMMTHNIRVIVRGLTGDEQ